MPAAPATQPSPNSGTLTMSARSPSRPATLASNEGTATPVTVVETMTSTSPAESPHCLQRAGDRVGGQVDGVLEERVVGRGEVAHRRVVLDRQDQVAEPHPGVLVEPAEHTAIAIGAEADLGERLGDHLLGVPMRRQNGFDGRHCAH